MGKKKFGSNPSAKRIVHIATEAAARQQVKFKKWSEQLFFRKKLEKNAVKQAATDDYLAQVEIKAVEAARRVPKFVQDGSTLPTNQTAIKNMVIF